MESPAERKLRLALSLGGLDDTVDSQASTPARAIISVRGLEERLEVLRRVATPEENLDQTHGAVARGHLPHLLPRRLRFSEDTADSTVSATLVDGIAQSLGASHSMVDDYLKNSRGQQASSGVIITPVRADDEGERGPTSSSGEGQLLTKTTESEAPGECDSRRQVVLAREELVNILERMRRDDDDEQASSCQRLPLHVAIHRLGSLLHRLQDRCRQHERVESCLRHRLHLLEQERIQRLTLAESVSARKLACPTRAGEVQDGGGQDAIDNGCHCLVATEQRTQLHRVRQLETDLEQQVQQALEDRAEAARQLAATHVQLSESRNRVAMLEARVALQADAREEVGVLSGRLACAVADVEERQLVVNELERRCAAQRLALAGAADMMEGLVGDAGLLAADVAAVLRAVHTRACEKVRAAASQLARQAAESMSASEAALEHQVKAVEEEADEVREAFGGLQNLAESLPHRILEAVATAQRRRDSEHSKALQALTHDNQVLNICICIYLAEREREHARACYPRTRNRGGSAASHILNLEP